MKIADFKQLCERVTERADEIMWSKNKDYAGPDGEDVMSNFRDMGKDLEAEGICSPGDGMAVVVWVFFKKHLDAVRSFHFESGEDSEPPIDRVADLYNYLRFMLAMREERDSSDGRYYGMPLPVTQCPDCKDGVMKHARAGHICRPKVRP